MTLISRCLGVADSGARLAVMTATAIMVVVVSAQVVMRYAFNGSFDWADEISRLAFVWAIFLAIPLGVSQGSHVGIRLLVERLPENLNNLIQRLMNLLAGMMMLVVFGGSIVVAQTTWSERLGSIDITSSVFFFPVIIGAAHSAIHLLVGTFAPRVSTS
ncbi:TRAP transporter small permease [Granulosicoccus sp. 3-233]|uniref:TRAP transporter small permease n=1 Tax=Granulosicoccus sp. 3-233 TaxID=3417969 RepID=UPI003D34DC05